MKKLTINIEDELYEKIELTNKSFLVSFLLKEFLENTEVDTLELIKITKNKDIQALKNLISFKAPSSNDLDIDDGLAINTEDWW